MKRNKKGFTLIELLIVVAIIAILAAIAVPNFLEAQMRAKVSRAKTEMRTLDVALTSYHVDQGDYPTWFIPPHGGNTPCSWRFNRLTTPVAYITSIPKDPFSLFKENDDKVTIGGVVYGIHDTYDYINFVGPLSDPPRLFGHFWRLNSFGPDCYDQYGGGRGAGVNQFPDFIYDPTNGTVSSGDILRVGPRCSESTTQYFPIEMLP